MAEDASSVSQFKHTIKALVVLGRALASAGCFSVEQEPTTKFTAADALLSNSRLGSLIINNIVDG